MFAPSCSWIFAWLRFSACASVLAQMNSTPLHALGDHVIDRVAAAAAHADHLDYGFLRLRIDDLEHVCCSFRSIYDQQ